MGANQENLHTFGLATEIYSYPQYSAVFPGELGDITSAIARGVPLSVEEYPSTIRLPDELESYLELLRDKTIGRVRRCGALVPLGVKEQNRGVLYLKSSPIAQKSAKSRAFGAPNNQVRDALGAVTRMRVSHIPKDPSYIDLSPIALDRSLQIDLITSPNTSLISFLSEEGVANFPKGLDVDQWRGFDRQVTAQAQEVMREKKFDLDRAKIQNALTIMLYTKWWIDRGVVIYAKSNVESVYQMVSSTSEEPPFNFIERYIHKHGIANELVREAFA